MVANTEQSAICTTYSVPPLDGGLYGADSYLHNLFSTTIGWWLIRSSQLSAQPIQYDHWMVANTEQSAICTTYSVRPLDGG